MRGIMGKNTFVLFCLAAVFDLLFICNLFLTAKGEECSVGGHKQHKTLCNQFYQCVNTEKGNKWTLKYCDEGLVYNPVFELCVLPDENWECPTLQESDQIKSDSDNINILQNLNDNIKYIKWFKVSQVQPTTKPEMYEYDVYNERFGKSKTVIVENANDEDNYEASGYGNVDVVSQEKNNIINTQILHLNQLMKDAKSKSSDSSILATEVQKDVDVQQTRQTMKASNTVTPSPDKDEFITEQSSSKKPVISEDVLKVLLEFSKELLSKPKHDVVAPTRQTLLQPIVRPIYINVPVQHPIKQEHEYNSNTYPNQITQSNTYYSNISQIPLRDSYGYPIASHLYNKNTYYPYQQPTYQYQRPITYQSPVASYPSASYSDVESYDTVYDDNSVEVSSEEMTGTKRFAYLGGTIFPYDQYKHSILPYLKRQEILDNVEVLSCSSNTRQPNKTDCTKYFVCNPQTGVHPFSCPLNTAFNEKSKLCDVKTYRDCKRSKTKVESMFLQRNKDTAQLHYEMLRAIEELKQLRKQAQFNIQQQSQQQIPTPIKYNPSMMSYLENTQNFNDDADEDDERPAPLPPPPSAPTIIVKQVTSKPRKRLTCLKPGKVADPESKENYYVCFKTTDNILKLHKMKCPQRFTFCKNSMLCVLPGTCI